MHAVLQMREFHQRAQLISSLRGGQVHKRAEEAGRKAADEQGEEFRYSAMCGFYHAAIDSFVQARDERELQTTPADRYVEIEYEGAVLQVCFSGYDGTSPEDTEITGYFIEGQHDIGCLLSDAVTAEIDGLAWDKLQSDGWNLGRPTPKMARAA